MTLADAGALTPAQIATLWEAITGQTATPADLEAIRRELARDAEEHR